MLARPALAAALALASAAVVLAACTTTGGPASPTTPSSAPTVDPGVNSLPTAEPTLHPGGTAEQNKQYWDATIERYVSLVGIGTGDTLTSHLRDAGFDLSTVEMTYDVTAAGYAPESIEVSVRFGDECLLADVRNGGWATSIGPVLGTGKCLIGSTRPVG